MTVALDIINGALIELGVLAVGETASAEDSALGLSALNDMLDGWNTQNLTIYATYDATFTFVPGQATYTIGPAGNWNGLRPVSLVSQYVKYQGVDFPIEQIDQETYNLIPIKTQPGILPQFVLFNESFPLGTMTFWPVPNTANTFTLSSNQLLTEPATLQTTLSMPPGYYRAMRLNLAVELSGRYGRTLSPVTLRMASTSLGDLRRLNKRTPVARFDEALLQSGSSYTRIIAGY
jgi:hypothetical protein